jgi:hypothetical protein
MKAWRDRHEARRTPNPRAWALLGALYLVTGVGGAVFLATLHGSGQTSVPMAVYWLLIVLWLGLAAQSFGKARRHHRRLTT